MNKLFLLFVIAVYSVNAYTLEGASRIVGGTYRSNINYVISLQEKQSTPTYERGHKCGGVLITRQNALTAASCVLNNNGQLINATNFRVFAGTVLTNDNADNVRDIASITVHPEYNRQTFVNDIAVITLQAAFPEAINPLPMPTGALTYPLMQPCESSGFGGRNATATASAQLITLSPVAVFASEVCNPMIPQMTVVPSMVCGSSVGGGCEGDIGNPLVCNTLTAPVLEGLLTRSNNCGVDVAAPEVFTQVFPFASWVNEVLSPTPSSSTPASSTTTTPAPGAASTSQLGTSVALMFVIIQYFKIFN
ncbi:transmembrane protease serine 9-like isoform X1 [Spodoptera litura]|uniref:Transmembrane protease serine 9-like isoform X1 n=1 Tax=Spodoptera litura TaxID=69820 RepID=A0A9J7EHB3_SPOLT|nr:transmembrane protease serine 9-like isoform X1 [Spodoptera litura]